MRGAAEATAIEVVARMQAVRAAHDHMIDEVASKDKEIHALKACLVEVNRAAGERGLDARRLAGFQQNLAAKAQENAQLLAMCNDLVSQLERAQTSSATIDAPGPLPMPRPAFPSSMEAKLNSKSRHLS